MTVIEKVREFCASLGLPAPPDGLTSLTITVIELTSPAPHVTIEFQCQKPVKPGILEEIEAGRIRYQAGIEKAAARDAALTSSGPPSIMDQTDS
jgi:hypothetical protein